MKVAEPLLTKRVRSHFTSDKTAFYKWVASLMTPISSKEASDLEAAMRSYVSIRKS